MEKTSKLKIRPEVLEHNLKLAREMDVKAWGQKMAQGAEKGSE